MNVMRKHALAGAIAALLAALYNPTAPFRIVSMPLVLLDESSSMFMTAESTRQALAGISTLTGSTSLQVIPFAGDVAPLQTLSPGSAPTPLPPSFNRLHTNIEAALALALAEAASDQPIFLLTDGIETMGDAAPLLRKARQQGHSVFVQDLSLARPATNSAGLLALELPQQVSVGAGFAAFLRANSSLEQPAMVTVSDGTNTLATQQLQLLAGTTTHVINLAATQTGVMHLHFDLQAEVDEYPLDNTRAGLVSVTGKANLLYVSATEADARDSALVSSLLAGGWNLTWAPPAQLARGIPAGINVVVLDNITVPDAPDTAWRHLDRAVGEQGIGLIVLGGDRAFGAGNYRGSALETLLPVTAEAGRPVAPVSILFLIDRSGSMDRLVAGTTGLAYAQQAVRVVTADTTDDEVGVTVFDVAPQILLPLAHYPDIEQAIATAWAGRTASGGTMLASAMELGIQQLGRAAHKQRMLVLISDGHSTGDTLAPSLTKIRELGIDVIVLAVGADADLELLQPLSTINRGALLRLDDVAQIPELMSEALGKRRLILETGPTQVMEARALPFLTSDQSWPGISGYSVTRAKDAATVFLAAESTRDPLLVAWQYGLGQVITLPAGLGRFALAWRSWPHWSMFAGGLVEWAAGSNQTTIATITTSSDKAGVQVVIDAIDRSGEWEVSGPAFVPALLASPELAVPVSLRVPRIAPGRYATSVPLSQTGSYRLGLAVADQQLQHDFYFAARSEWGTHDSSHEAWFKAGLAHPITSFEPASPVHLRGILLVIALIFYSLNLLTLAFQRRKYP